MRKGILGSLTAVLAGAGLAVAQAPEAAPPAALPAVVASDQAPAPGAAGRPQPDQAPAPSGGAAAQPAPERIAAPRSAGTAPGQAPAPAGPCPPVMIEEAPMSILAGRFYGSADYLFWWTKGHKLPPLVTTGPDLTLLGSATAAVLGQPGTAVLFGDRRVDDNARSGIRATAGYWFDGAESIGFEVSGFLLNNAHTNFSATSNGSTVLARPFVDVSVPNGGAENAFLVAYALQSGTVSVATRNEVWGAEGDLRANVAGCSWYRADLLAGFRYLQVRDDLDIASTSTGLNGNFIPIPGQPNLAAVPVLSLTDFVHTRNDFYGGQLGAWIEVKRNNWFADFTGKLALGVMHQVVDIGGATTAITAAGLGTPGGTLTFPGGLFAQAGQNLGRHTRNEFGIVPEAGVNVGYQFGEHLKAYVGYSIIYFRTDVVRPGSQIAGRTSAINGGTQPIFNFIDQDFWAQGLNAGVEIGF